MIDWLLGGDPAIRWQVLRDLGNASPDDVAAERARLEEERASALCDEILTGPSQWWRQRLWKAEGGATAGMVKQLLDRMRTLDQSTGHVLPHGVLHAGRSIHRKLTRSARWLP